MGQPWKMPVHPMRFSNRRTNNFGCAYRRCLVAGIFKDSRRAMRFDEKVVLIVGASSGIGRVLALRLAAEGARVVITARRKDRLDKVANDIMRIGGHCVAYAADSESADAAEHVVDTCLQLHGRIDILILNAGAHQPSICAQCVRTKSMLTCAQITTLQSTTFFPCFSRCATKPRAWWCKPIRSPVFLAFPCKGLTRGKRRTSLIDRRLSRRVWTSGNQIRFRLSGVYRDRGNNGGWHAGPAGDVRRQSGRSYLGGNAAATCRHDVSMANGASCSTIARASESNRHPHPSPGCSACAVWFAAYRHFMNKAIRVAMPTRHR